jgi:aspartyl-tRNA(Asn)/glutamyl-tRNA(Gln) amidotransferase subunit B
MAATNYQLSVGMECHAELLTQSKMFCGCENAFGGDPNSRTCPICLGMPGTLPVFNKMAVENVVKAALALNCDISMRTIFHRKNYFYPDLPKGYQISQYGRTPIGIDGYLEIEKADGTLKKIRITRVHLEEDTGKSIHSDAGYSVMDYNRAGVPLMEIVTDFPPDVEDPEEARLYGETLREILVYLGVTDGRMEQGSLRVEPNPSVRPVGATEYGVKTEIKNLNSFRSVERGVAYERDRHIAAIERGEKIIQATFGWDADKEVTVMQRTKEGEADYRYFPEPDLIPIEFDEDYIAKLRAELPELPLYKKRRLMETYNLPAPDAALLSNNLSLGNYFETAAKQVKDPKLVANWLLGDISSMANATNTPLYETQIDAENLAKMVGLIEDGTITGRIAKDIVKEMFETGKPAAQIVSEKNLAVTGSDAVAEMVARVIAANPDVVAKIKGGNENSVQFLFGQVMKEAKGQAKPDDVRRLLTEQLG